MRFSMAKGAWGWLLRLFGATKDTSYVAVEAGELEAHFGPLFHKRYRLEEIDSAALWRREVPWYATGIGWRANLRGSVGLISASRNVVKVTLKAPHPVNVAGLPVQMKELYVSLEEPDRFLGAMKATGIPVEATAQR